jgi:acyl-CoA reductase-like NAD-dependent aldehyde dehydrogenase/uncharacterized protein (DUF2141 family)
MTVDAAATRVAQARIAQAAWATLTPAQRVHALRPLRQVIAQRMDEIIATISDEIGKPPMDALTGDVMVTLEHLRFYERCAVRVLRPHRTSRSRILFSGTRFDQTSEPHGVVLICAPWNYPLQLALVPMATALFAGNAVLLKCSENTPRSAQLIIDLCAAAALPANLVQVSYEAPAAAEALIDAHPDFIFFTGSNGNGRAVAAKAAALTIPTIMEFGGKDAALVFDSCDLARTVNGLTYGAFSNAGQVCVGTKRIYVQQSIYDQFLGNFLERVRQLRIGTTLDSELGPIRIEAVRQRLRAQLDDAVARGAQLHTAPGAEDAGPIVLTGVPADALLLLDESFGPVVCITPFTHETDAIAAANGSAFALSASIWTRDKTQAQRVASALDTGTCAINDVIRNIGNPYSAFGGNKSSGHGRYHGEEGLRAFTRTKSTMTVTHPRPVEVHWFPFRISTFNRLRTLLLLRHGGNLRAKIKSLKGLWMLLPFLLCVASPAKPSPPSGSLAVEITLPPQAHGQIAYLVFSSSDGFPDTRTKALVHNFVPVTPSPTNTERIDIGTLPLGHYAVAVYLDENGNQKLDKNWMGLPKEAVGVSNNPRKRMGPPHFEDAVFTHGLSPQVIPITLVYCCKS